MRFPVFVTRALLRFSSRVRKPVLCAHGMSSETCLACFHERGRAARVLDPIVGHMDLLSAAKTVDNRVRAAVEREQAAMRPYELSGAERRTAHDVMIDDVVDAALDR